MLEELPVPFGLWTWLYRVWWFYRPLEASPSVPTDRTAHTHSHGAKRLLPALEGGQAVQCVGPQDARVAAGAGGACGPDVSSKVHQVAEKVHEIGRGSVGERVSE